MPPTTLDLDGLQELLWGFASHRVITVAGRCGLLRRLAASPASPERVATELELDELATGKMVRALTALGLVEVTDHGYRVVPSLAPLLGAGPNDVTPFFEHSHDMYDGWGENLEPWLRGGQWPTRPRTPEGMRRFGAAMRAMGVQVADMVVDSIDLDGVKRVLDVGGGFGQYARALCNRNPDLQATVLDVPEVAAKGRAELAGSELEERIEFVGGDYLENDYGQGYDLVLLVNVLHQESRDAAAAMVARSAAALAPGGRVMVVDFAIDEAQQTSVLGALFAINMRSFGDTYPEPVIRGWLEAAGLGSVDRIDIGRHRWAIVGRAPE